MKKKCICRYEGCCYVPVKECLIHGDLVKNSLVWEKEFEQELYVPIGGSKVDIEFKNHSILAMFENYLGEINRQKIAQSVSSVEGLKVKIKCKKDCIQIERVKK